MKQTLFVIVFSIFCSQNNGQTFQDVAKDASKTLDYIRNISTNLGALISDKYIDMNAHQQLQEMNFDSESHKLTTADGYHLELIRIVNPYLSYRTNRLKPILIQHGLLSNSDFFLTTPYPTILGPDNVLYNEKNLPTTCDPRAPGPSPKSNSSQQTFASTFTLMLANCGYDVWLGNFRGNYYSNSHVNLSQFDPEFWDYTMDSLSDIDLPRMVDYILLKTDRKSIAYIGHSMGTTAMFQLLADRKEYRSKVELFIALGPVGPMTDKVGQIERILSPLAASLSYLNVNALLVPSTELALLRRALANDFCRYTVFLPVCVFLVQLVSGFGRTNPALVPQGMGHYPDTTSFKLISHMAQRIQSNGTMFKFDFGPEGNLLKYRSARPPVYNIGAIESTKIVLVSGTQDELASPENVRVLARALKNVHTNYQIEGYNHRDFIFGMDASVKITRWMAEIMQKVYPK